MVGIIWISYEAKAHDYLSLIQVALVLLIKGKNSLNNTCMVIVLFVLTVEMNFMRSAL